MILSLCFNFDKTYFKFSLIHALIIDRTFNVHHMIRSNKNFMTTINSLLKANSISNREDIL